MHHRIDWIEGIDWIGKNLLLSFILFQLLAEEGVFLLQLVEAGAEVCYFFVGGF